MDFEDPIEQNIERRIEAGRGAQRWGRALALSALLIVLVLGALAIFFRMKINSPFSKSSATEIFKIDSGERSRSISDKLYSQGLISSSWIFDLYLAASGKTQRIEAGTYVLSPSMSMHQIADQLVSGKVRPDVTVVQFKEGWTILDIENYLAQNNVISAAQFDAAQKKIAAGGEFGETLADGSLEGYIFPDTYFVSGKPNADEIINKALDNLSKKLTPEMRDQISAQHKNVYQVLTMASIVEREVGRHSASLSDADLAQLDMERKLVAGIFYKRLQLGMPLQSDATIGYITKKKDASATLADLQINSPYNTYKFTGLPPGPISNPSLSSIEAAINPQTSDYLYFLSKPDGTAVFAKTLQEQNANKAKYLK